MKALYQICLMLAGVLSLAAALLCVTYGEPGFDYLPFLPLAYLVFVLAIAAINRRSMPSIFLSIFLFVGFLRYTVFPVLMVINGGYVGRSSLPPVPSSFAYAIFLMCYELLLVGTLIAVLEHRYHRAGRRKELRVHCLPLWFSLAVLSFGLALVLLEPLALLLVNFIRPTLLTAAEFTVPPLATFAGMIVVMAATFIILKILKVLSELTGRWRKIAPWIAALICTVNIAIFFGTNRLAVVLSAIATILIYLSLFESRSRQPLALVGVVTIVVFLIITEERGYVAAHETPLENLADQVQAYTGGIYNVALGVEVAKNEPDARRLSVLVYDFLRPTIGVNLLVESWGIRYSNMYFNDRMFLHVERRSQILPMVAQGNLFFPTPFAPVLSLLFVWLAYKLLDLLRSTSYMEIKYGLVLIIARLAFFPGQNSMNMMNYISLYLLLPLFFIWMYLALNRALSLRRAEPLSNWRW